jgi:predicted nucleic-acid-binding protein
MIGLDTNILVRYLTLDHPVQSSKAVALIERNLTLSDPGFISVVTMIETVWVLRKPYGFSREEVAGHVEFLLRADTLVVEHERAVHDAMSALRENRGDFADSLIASSGARMGCSHTLTFDGKAARLPGFELLH